CPVLVVVTQGPCICSNPAKGAVVSGAWLQAVIKTRENRWGDFIMSKIKKIGHAAGSPRFVSNGSLCLFEMGVLHEKTDIHVKNRTVLLCFRDYYVNLPH